METVIVLARIGSGALAALIGSAALLLIMAFLLLGGRPKTPGQQ